MSTLKRYYKTCMLTISLLMVCINSHAQDNISYELDQHIVYYNVFNSSLITAEVASNYNLIRAKDRVYINIALVKKSGGYGIAPEKLEVQYRNLLQQKFPLELIKIKESTATYYLAAVRFNNEDILHFDVTIQATADTKEKTFSFTKKLYKD